MRPCLPAAPPNSKAKSKLQVHTYYLSDMKAVTIFLFALYLIGISNAHGQPKTVKIAMAQIFHSTEIGQATL